MHTTNARLAGVLLALISVVYGCSSSEAAPRDGAPATGAGGTIGTLAGGTTGAGGSIGTTGTGGTGNTDNPATCAEAAAVRSYVGCEFWPTVTYNPVWSVFDFAAVVANAGDQPADVKVERAGMEVASATVAPGSLAKLYLPWVTELKGGDFGADTTGSRPTTSVRLDKGAYRLTSSVPVIAWQFNPLEYKAQGGPPNKTWNCPYPPSIQNGNGHDCLSVSNDASLLLPTTAMTGHYRLFGKSGSQGAGGALSRETPGGYAITATKDGTSVDVYVTQDRRMMVTGPTGFVAGPGVAATPARGKITFPMNAGDVVQLLGAAGPYYDQPDFDLSGSVVDAHDSPIQIISTIPITDIPTPETAGNGYADHVEETVLPGESIGKHYFVAPPTTPNLTTVGHYVRFYGNVAGTVLTYPSGGQPPGAPTALNAGDVVEIGPINGSFEVTGDKAFAIGSFMMGGEKQDPTPGPDGAQGDPAFTLEVTVEQFRTKYIFLAPDDYNVAVADVILPGGANVKIDGADATGMREKIGTSNYFILRQKLDAGTNHGEHVLESGQPVGLQVVGFGHATGIYYPGGLNLKLISPPPDIK